ncbi:MAG: ParB N-terminal domain-containing protein [Phyllobacteriaceae bacterium]|nr:ParB N-terminal domain-containing protein [Phyllobacteriaceae bacterium]
MLRIHKIRLDGIYVPVKRKKTLDAARVQALAEDMLMNGMKIPIQLRPVDGARHVFVEGLHRLEAARSLGDTEIAAFLVQAQKH